ncbi:hypothetical protein H7U08_06980 [Bacillus cereus]|uniref:Uncharacterized protein n=1 Tax=Bacillus cereus TaxID=1396 RepID=A0AAW4QUP9_BACCE|nr:hypothetical protein [Bacillus cereus]KLA27752.1 hypothetical protein B4080_4491 [Bacillus cereus]MBY0036319.1 hypothetical protein [Bacillus cereus]
MINKIVVSLIQERVADTFGFPVYRLDNGTELTKELFIELMYEMEYKDHSFYMDDIIAEAHKVGMTAEEVLQSLTEVCNAYKDIIEILEHAPEVHKQQLINKFYGYINDGLRAETKTFLN